MASGCSYCQSVSNDSAQHVKSLSSSSYSACEILYPYSSPAEYIGEMEITYSCSKQLIIGKNSKGKIKWQIDTNMLISPFVSQIRKWEHGKFDVLITFYNMVSMSESYYYLFRSKNGKFEHVERTDLIFEN